jgi:hypothetical protein
MAKQTGKGIGADIFPNYPPPPSPLDTQKQLEGLTGIKLDGVLGGLPVAEQNQEYFAVFDEAGDAGPELIDKTQFRITYLVDSQLNTSKPTTDTDAASNATQNFGKGKTVIVRADNATVLNQNLSGEQVTYDVGTLTLLSTTETGSQPSAYTSTASFNNSQGQDILTDAQNLISRFTASEANNTLELGLGESKIVNFPATAVAISQSNGTNEWIDFTTNNTYTLVQSTYAAGTRIRFVGTIWLQQVANDTNLGGSPIAKIELLLNDQPIKTTYNVIGGPNNLSYNPTWEQSIVQTQFLNFNAGDELKIKVTHDSNDYSELDFIKFRIIYGDFKTQQEYTQGEVDILGVNAITAPYFEPYYSTNTGSLLNNDGGYSVLTASIDFASFIGQGFTFDLHPDSKTWDPGNGSTFNPITTELDFRVGDEIRFEYNKNKVHKVIESVANSDGRYYITVSPYIASQSVVDHFTHYRIVPNGGYLIANVEKNNEVNEFQPFSGIILPQYPSEALQERSDRLIYELKQADIIEK